MINGKEEQRCKTCKRIIVGESKTGICPECARKGKNIGLTVLAAIGTGITFVVTKGRKK